MPSVIDNNRTAMKARIAISEIVSNVLIRVNE